MQILLAHAGGHAAVGPGPTTMQTVVVAGTAGLLAVVVVVMRRRLPLASAGDLVLPLASVVIAASFVGGFLPSVVGSWFPWAVPLGTAVLVCLVVVAATDWEVTSWPVGGLFVLVTVAGMLSVTPILTPDSDPSGPPLPVAGDASIAFSDLSDGAELEPGRHTIMVEVRDGTVGPPVVGDDALPDDVDELGHVRLFRGFDLVPTASDRECRVAAPCREVAFEVTLEEGEHVLVAEFLSAAGLPFVNPVSSTVRVVVG